MRSVRMPKYALALFAILFAFFVIGAPVLVHPASAATSYRVTAIPLYSQEGSTITFVLVVSGASPGTTYEFEFLVTDPSTAIWTSNHQRNNATQFEFGIIINYPSSDFSGGASTSLAGKYTVDVKQINPLTLSNPVASYDFYVGLTDKTKYQRTETVSIIATDYSPLESVYLEIRTSAPISTLLYSNTVSADTNGRVADWWYIPKTSTISEGSYIVTLTGASTAKNPADSWPFNVEPATLTVSALSSSSTIYQRTQTFVFSFQPNYPSGELADTGLALITLTRPDSVSRTLTASYDGETGAFVSTYKTTLDNQTGTWTASLQSYSFDDNYGNVGPDTSRAVSVQLMPATLSITIQTKTTFTPPEPIAFNATIRYPDGVNLQTGSVSYTLAYSGGGYTVSGSLIFDTALQLWFGNYALAGNEPSGLWSLSVGASDAALPTNSGSSTRAIQIQNRPPIATFTSSTSSALTAVPIGFDASGSSDLDGTIASYLWNFGDGSTGSGISTAHSFYSSGVYTVRLTVTDNGGAAVASNATVSIQNRPPTAILTGPTTTAQTGASVSFDGISSSDSDGSIVNYSWSFGDGTTGAGQTTSHSYSNPGTYTVTLTVTDNNGSTASTTFAVNVEGAGTTGDTSSFPLYYFGILAAALAAGLGGAFLFFKKHRVTHTKLKIDLEAVRTEAGRIENQEFFQSVKEQLKKDKDD